MTATLWHRIDILARRLSPFGLTLLLAGISVVPRHVSSLEIVFPLLPLMAVYHWAVYKPELTPCYAVFTIGLLQDILTGAPLGVNALAFLGVHGVVLSQRRFFSGKSFAVVWLGFAIVAAGAMLAIWLLVSVYSMSAVFPGVIFFQYLLTLGCFPFLAWFFLRWQRAVLKLD